MRTNFRIVNDTSRGLHVFEWATGQDDNIGDSLLRRPSISDARSRGDVLHLFHGSSTYTFETGLGLEHGDISYRGFTRWIFAALRSGFVRRTLIVPNAGEVRVSRRGSVRTLLIWIASLAPKSRTIWIGAGVPGEPSIWSIPYRLLARHAKVAAFRDAESVALLRTGRVAPDWAFVLGAATHQWPNSAERTRLAFVLRGDRAEPSGEWLRWAERTAAAMNLTPTFVSQVRRDNVRAASLATKINGDAIIFDDATSHADQESRVREVYRDTRIVVGDRLHGLIVAASEGAIPLGWVEASTGKIDRHFSAVSMPFVGQYEGESGAALPAISNSNVDAWAATLKLCIDEARAEISSIQTAADHVAKRRGSGSGE